MIMTIDRRRFLTTATAAAAGAATVPLWRGRARAQAKPVRIGYTLSATGPYAVGAGITQAPNYTLWQEQVNAKGGLAVKGEGRRMVEFLTIDDRSEIETAVRFYEKLATDDKVDLLLPPWGSAMNFAIAPVAGKYGYPMIGPTAISGKFKELALPYFYTLLVQPEPQMRAVAAMFKDLRDQGKIKKVGVAYVNDLFGIELNTATGPAFKAAGLEVADTKSYPLGAKDLSPILKGFKDAGVDAFVGLTYPPDNILATTQAKEVDWNPAVFFTGVGTAFPFYRDRFKGAEGVMGIAGWNAKVKFPGAKDYFDAHVKKHQKEPDRWASAFAYASLQMLERCVGEVGLDRPKIKAMLDTTEFQTVAGPIKFAKGENVATPGTVGQWQKNEFELVWPKASSTGAAVVPKPAWA
jgi:branched-chain amino acid transport system substrate-binding protein